MSATTRPGIRAFGAAVALFRRTRGLSQEDLAWDAGISTTHLSRIERGRTNPSWLVMVNIAEALDCELVEIFDEAVRGEVEVRHSRATGG
jgi:DNA-binding XRE family transcriptional regulator